MLEIAQLRKHYGEVVALDGVSLQANPGRLLGFLGPNGSGKTTTMRAVFGLVRPDSGALKWCSAAITGEHLLRFGYMPEQRGLYPRMPIIRQLRYLGRLHGMETVDAAAATDRWLAELGLADRAGDRLGQLSHGNQQRVQLAAALLHEPDLLILDEPFSGLDPLGVEAMSSILRSRADRGACVVFSSHQLDLVEDLCDDVVIIASGRDRISGTLEAVRAAGGTHRVRLRLAGGEAFTPPPESEILGEDGGVTRLRVPPDTDAKSFLAQVDGTVERFSLEPPRLSEVFRDVVGADARAREADLSDVTS